MTRVDAHLHVWRAAEGDTPGVTTIVPPQTDVPIELARQTMLAHNIDRAVLVQPVFRRQDNSYVADCARADPEHLAAVCVIDCELPHAEQRLEYWVRQGCRGLRLRPKIASETILFGHPWTYPLWKTAERLKVVVSVLANPEHAQAIGFLAQQFPDVSIVIDHMGHPNPTAGASDPGMQALLNLAQHPRVFLKVSGFYHFSNSAFPFEDCWELIWAAYDSFGPDRLIWGSDFPHVLRTIGYPQSLLLPEQALESWSNTDQEKIMGGNAAGLYWT